MDAPSPTSARLYVAKEAWLTSRIVAVGLLLSTLSSSIGPVLLRLAIANLIADLAGAPLVDHALALVGASLLFVSAGELARVAFGKLMTVRMTHSMQSRLIEDLNRPSGIEHLYMPQVSDDIAAAQGALGSYFPASAAQHLSAVASTRFDGLIAAFAVGILLSFWAGVALLVIWLIVRKQIRREVLLAVRALGGEMNAVRRARYIEGIVTSVSAGKETRLFSSLDWLLSRFRANWVEAMTGTRRALARLRRAAGVYGGLVLAVNAVAFAILGRAASRDLDLERAVFLVFCIPAVSGLALLGESGVILEFCLESFPRSVRLSGEGDRQRSDFRDSDYAGVVESVLRSSPTEIELRGVGFQYPNGTAPVFDGLDLVIEAGLSTAVVGANGVGKSTLVRLLAGLFEPTSGEIVIGGRRLDDEWAATWRREIRCVFQDIMVLPMSLRDNVAFGAASTLEDATIIGALSLAGLTDELAILPLGLDTPMSSALVGGVDLSGGQLQRLALARVAVAVRRGSRLVILDEPTAALDPRGERDVFQRVLQATAGCTTILISHRFSTVRLADRIVVLEGHGVTEVGSHDELMTLNGTYARMFRLQAKAFVE